MFDKMESAMGQLSDENVCEHSFLKASREGRLAVGKSRGGTLLPLFWQPGTVSLPVLTGIIFPPLD